MSFVWILLDLALIVVPIVMAVTVGKKSARSGLVIGGAVVFAIAGFLALLLHLYWNFLYEYASNISTSGLVSSISILPYGILPLVGVILIILGSTPKTPPRSVAPYDQPAPTGYPNPAGYPSAPPQPPTPVQPSPGMPQGPRPTPPPAAPGPGSQR